MEDARALIAEFGGLGALIVEGGVITDPDKPWRVSEAPDDSTAAQVVVIEEVGGATAYLPMKGLTFEPTRGMIIQDAGGAFWHITENPAILNPNGSQPILATCKVARWPTL